MQLSKNLILVICFILWPIIIGITQFNLNYFSGLLAGTLNYGEIPIQFYLGLVSGVFAAMFFWGLSTFIAYVITKSRKKEFRGSIMYLYITLSFFVLMLITQAQSIYIALTLTEAQVEETRELIQEYESH